MENILRLEDIISTKNICHYDPFREMIPGVDNNQHEKAYPDPEKEYKKIRYFDRKRYYENSIADLINSAHLKKSGPVKEEYKSSSQQDPKAKTFKAYIKQYQASLHWQDLENYLLNVKGRKLIPLTAVKSGKLPRGTLAALLIEGNKSTIISNESGYGFDGRTKRFEYTYRKQYADVADFENKIPLKRRQELVKKYIIDHENTHRSQSHLKGLYKMQNQKAETDVEKTLSEFYGNMTEKYRGTLKENEYKYLQKIANHRFKEVPKNYSKAA